MLCLCAYVAYLDRPLYKGLGQVIFVVNDLFFSEKR